MKNHDNDTMIVIYYNGYIDTVTREYLQRVMLKTPSIKEQIYNFFTA